MHFNEDDRAQRLLNVFPEINGQINISYVNSTNHIVAWHKHNIQTDYWICLKGSFKVGLAYPIEVPQEAGDIYNVKWEYLSDKNFQVLTIPPGVYHGYMALEPNSILMYYLTEKYNESDEYRASVGHFGEYWKTENK
jgi:dTDP-4-dehydrorhamnose 3,5-epimerase